MNKSINYRASLLLSLATALVGYLGQAHCFAAVKDIARDLPDTYLGTEFTWAMVLDLPDMRHYLNYPGTKLSPIAKVQVHFRSYPHEYNRPPSTNTLYEELWYHNDVPIGLRRYNQISIPAQCDGAIVVCPRDVTSDEAQRASAITDAIVRLVVDVQFRNTLTGLVLVPSADYDNVAEGLSRYKFLVAHIGSPIRPISIHLRAYPKGKDQIFYLQK